MRPSKDHKRFETTKIKRIVDRPRDSAAMIFDYRWVRASQFGADGRVHLAFNPAWARLMMDIPSWGDDT